MVRDGTFRSPELLPLAGGRIAGVRKQPDADRVHEG